MGATQAEPELELKAKYYLGEDWKQGREIPAITSAMSDDDKKVLAQIRETSIKVAPRAQTVKFPSPPGRGPGVDYLKSEVGMNIILPKGRITELRFNITLTQVGGSQDTCAMDGFPNSTIRKTTIVGGQIKIGISKTFHLIPVVGPVLAELLSVDFNPWTFHIGSLRKVHVAFNGGLTPEPQWYFKEAGIRNDTIRIAMILEKSAATTEVKADVRASWVYKPSSLLPKKRVGSDPKTLIIYAPE